MHAKVHVYLEMSMRRVLTLAALCAGTFAFAQFTPGNLVVRIVGDGGADTTGAQATSLREYTVTGTQVGSDLSLNNLPGGRNVSNPYGETSEANMSLSRDGRFLIVSGYDIAPRDISFDVFNTPRVVGRVNVQTKAIELSNTFVPLAGDGIRGTYSPDGDKFWTTGGDAGLLEGTFAGPVNQVLPSLVSSRFVAEVGGVILFSGSNAFGGSNGFATWDGTNQVELFATPNGASSRNWVVIGDTMYLATSTGAQGLMKLRRNAGTGAYDLQYQLGGIGVGGLAVVGNDVYATRSNGVDLLKTTDSGTSFAAWTVVAVAATNTRFRGLSFIPRPAAEEIFPTSFNRLRGRVDAGDVNSLRGDDNNRLRVCRFIVPNDPARIIEVDYLGSTTVASPSSFKLDVRSRSTVGGLVQQTLQVFNYQTNAFDTTDFNQVNLNTTLTTRTVNGTGTLSRLVGPAGALRAKQTIRIVGPVPNPNVCKETTLVRWTIGS